MQLPKFIYSQIEKGNTSIGKNKALPRRDDVPYEYIMLKHRYREVIEDVEKTFGSVPSVEDAETMLNKFVVEAQKKESGLIPQLEKLCEYVVTKALGVPQETVIVQCDIVGKIEPDNELRILPEYDEEEPTYTFDDVDELYSANTEILKRRFIDSIVQGASYSLMKKNLNNEKLEEWSGDLYDLYSKIIALNDYLLFSKQEKITDNNPMLGSYVETHLGVGDDKTVIHSQGLIYPLLLQETFRGFFELFASHGLPSDNDMANYIVHHADFIMAEAWDLRLGVPLWDEIIKNIKGEKEDSLYPYMFSALVQYDTKEFNKKVQNMLCHTRRGKEDMSTLISQIKHDAEYNQFKNDIEKFNLERCMITDDEDVSGDDGGGDIVEEDVDFKKKVAISINCDYDDFDIKIINGQKTIETRENRKLDKLVGHRVGLIRTSSKKKPILFGYCTLGECEVYDTQDKWDKASVKHAVDKGSKYDLSNAKKGIKYGYPLLDVEVLDNPIVLKGAKWVNGLYFTARYIDDDSQESLSEQIAYHGGKNEFDAFSTDFMSSGEGTQCYGWGVYVTSDPDVGKFYCDASQRTSQLSIDGRPAKEYTEEEINELGEPFISIYKMYRISMAKTLSDIQNIASEIYEDSLCYKNVDVESLDSDSMDVQRIKSVLKRAHAAEVTLRALKKPEIYNRLIQGKKIFYSVDIPDDNGSNYLYWEKEYDGDFIRNMASSLGGRLAIELYNRTDGFARKLTGESIYKALEGERYYGDDEVEAKEASLKLNSIGFDGISMPIGFINHNYEGTGRNYVVFDASKVKVLNKEKISENVSHTDKLLNEIFDKEYMKPLYDYLKNGEKYSSEGHYSPSERLVIPFFQYVRDNLSESDFKKFGKALQNCHQLHNKIRCTNFMGRNAIECYSSLSDGLKRVPMTEFLRDNARRIFTITYHDTELAHYWDDFMSYINSDDGNYSLRRSQSLDADTALMNPEIKSPQWLIHFTSQTSDALDICKNGFKYGLLPKQKSHLAYTNKDIQKDEKQGKYLYAYNAEEITDGFFPTSLTIKPEEWQFKNKFDQKAWEMALKNVVMFTAQGIEVHHSTDKQQQVIFNADNAHNFVLITFKWDQKAKANEKDTRAYKGNLAGTLQWMVNTTDGDCVYSNSSLTKVIQWVIDNFTQYRKQICWKK